MTDIDTKPLRELLALIKTTTEDYEFKALEEHEAYEFAAAVPALLDAADERDRLKAKLESLQDKDGFWVPADWYDKVEAENKQLREALAEVRDTLEQDGRFPNAVPAISAALEGKP